MATSKRIDIYGHRTRSLKREEALLQESQLSERNKELIVQWRNGLFAADSGESRVSKLSSQLRTLAGMVKERKLVKRNLDDLEVPDFENLLAAIKLHLSWSVNTKADYRRCIKQFYRWFRKRDERLMRDDAAAKAFYECVDEMELGYKVKKVDYSEIILDDDLRLLIEKGCRSLKERAFLAVLHESGFRAGEMLNIRFKDVEVTNEGAVITVDGKTGPRRRTLFTSAAYLHHWMDIHPLRHQGGEAVLWISESPSRMHQPLQHGGAQKLVATCAKRADFKKKHNLHWFRHSRATLLAPHMSESSLCLIMGWEVGSDQIKIYNHVDIAQAEDAIRRMYHLKGAEEVVEQVRKCLGCGLVNDAGRRFCGRCGKPLTTEAAAEEKDALQEALRLMAEIMRDPAKMSSFERFKEERSA